MTSSFRPKHSHNNFRVQPAAAGGLEAVCTKRKYDDERQAKDAMNRALHMGMTGYYRCQHCESWHISSQRNRSPWAHLPRLPPDELNVCMQIRRILQTL
jgi:hypothetical protein